MTRIVLSRQAGEDLRDIWLYSAKTWGRAQADAYVNGLRATLGKLGHGTSAPRSHPALSPAYRCLHHKRHVIILRLDGQDARVIRILHDRMDPARHLSDDG